MAEAEEIVVRRFIDVVEAAPPRNIAHKDRFVVGLPGRDVLNQLQKLPAALGVAAGSTLL
jgi:hypothetical protein